MNINGRITVDKGIPIPEMKTKYPWKEMEVGDSFLFNGKGSAGNVKYANMKYAPARFIMRKTDEGTRVWRVE